MTKDQLDAQMNHVFDRLLHDLGTDVPVELVTAVGTSHFERLEREATVNEFIPLLVYRFTREELVAARHADLRVWA
jgi:hypothetical protein